MAVLKRYMSKKQICDILVIAPKAKKKKRRQITTTHESSICAIFKRKDLQLHDDCKFHIFHQPIKNEPTGTSGCSENHFYLKPTDLKNLRVIKHAADGNILEWTTHTLTTKRYCQEIRSSTFFFSSPTCTIIFCPAATICKQHTERAEL